MPFPRLPRPAPEAITSPAMYSEAARHAFKNVKKYIESSYLGNVEIISSWGVAWRHQRTPAIDKVVGQNAVAHSDHYFSYAGTRLTPQTEQSKTGSRTI